MTFDMAQVDGYPFTDFVENAESYAHSRVFWLSTFIETIGAEATRWHPWMNDPLKDGHPIFSMVDESQSRGVMLQQVVKTDDSFWFKCWMSKTTNAEGKILPYLGIETFISTPSRLLFETAMENWIIEQKSYDEMTMISEKMRFNAYAEYERTCFDF